MPENFVANMHKLETFSVNNLTDKWRDVFKNQLKLMKIRKSQRNELKKPWRGGIIQNTESAQKNS